MPALIPTFREMTREEMLLVPIEACELGTRAKMVLLSPQHYVKNPHILRKRWYEGHEELLKPIATVGELVAQHSMAVLMRPGCGRKTLNEMRDGLRAVGLSFRNEVREG